MRGEKNPLRAQAEAHQSPKSWRREFTLFHNYLNTEFKILLVQEAAEEFNLEYMNKPSVFGPAGGTRPEPSLQAFIVLAFPSRAIVEHKKPP